MDASCLLTVPPKCASRLKLTWEQQQLTSYHLQELHEDIMHLHIKRCQPPQRGWTELFRQLQLKKQLTILWLNYSCLRDQALLCLTNELTHLRHICLSKNNITNLGAIRLSQCLPSVLTLNVSCNQIEDQGAVALVLALTTSDKLFLDNNMLSPACKLLLRSLIQDSRCHVGL